MARKTSPTLDSPVAVIGLGRFGQALALELVEGELEVLGIDSDAGTVQAFAGLLTHTAQADSTDVEALRQLSVHECDRAVIGIGTNLEASILTASVLLELEVPNIWAKAITESHARILTRLGVHHVVRPEYDMGRRVAHLVRGRMLDYIEFGDGFAIVKTTPPRELVGQPLSASRPRSRHGVTIVGVKRAGADFAQALPETVVEAYDLLIVSGPRDRVERFSEMS